MGEVVDWQEDARLFLLNKTPLGYIYQNFLKRFRPTRAFVIWGWKKFFPLWVTVYKRFSSRVRKLPLEKLSMVPGQSIKFTEQEVVKTPAPEIFPRRLAAKCPSPHEEYTFPAIYTVQVSGCSLRGSSNFLIGSSALYHHDLFRAPYDYTSEELHGRLVIKPAKGTSYLLPYHKERLKVVEEAAVFTDALSSNYAHFMTEVLPRIAMFVTHVPGSMPLVIDAGLHANIMSAIELLAGSQRELILLERGREMHIKKAHVISNCGYVPFERRSGSEGFQGHSQGQFSPVALKTIREEIFGKLKLEARGGKRLFIRRNSGYRNVLNAKEIEEILVARGFEVVEPEKLSFAEQVAVFSSADIVVGATGAAFANLLFCKPGTQLVIMIAQLENTSYYYWQSMACASGNAITYVFGSLEQGVGHSIHSDFHVDPQHIIDAINAPLPNVNGGGSEVVHE
ncbi:glycosyltransferase family 61 protein [Pseudomonas sp. P66]|uniref:Glycosyltransferase family 61 protein n=1 Tax=Pseudomonas arcuscaelestis TaxID=2710591 RepID=A0ABS2C849_9PSED|nr:glycosyltransferase family 61 protein [Pseudomonas arcuscaelestis]MBM5461513.1 glycosyltransferase family 61 protein [Pseudomonas arcuscaelestis]